MVGRLVPASGGTLIETAYPLSPIVAIFSFLHGLMLCGFTWLIAYFAYYAALKAARKLMEQATGATLFDFEARQKASEHPVSDPSAPGAAAQAPLSFHAKSTMDEARFDIEDRTGERSWLSIQSTGIDLRGDGRDILDWNDLLGVELVEDPGGNHILLRTRSEPLRLPIDGHPEADQLWMVCYLTARNARWSEGETERARTEAERARLEAMQSRHEQT